MAYPSFSYCPREDVGKAQQFLSIMGGREKGQANHSQPLFLTKHLLYIIEPVYEFEINDNNIQILETNESMSMQVYRTL